MTQSDVLIINDNLQIPLAELSFQFATSGGPGGQHVNKTATKAVLRFDVKNSPSLSEEQREKILVKCASKINQEGYLTISSKEHRSQLRNKEEAISKFMVLLAEAMVEQKERKKTKVPRRSKEKRLREKKQTSDKKKQRRWKPE